MKHTIISDMSWYNLSHKKRKDNQETSAERAVLHTYVANQTILKPILLYGASKCKQTKKLGY